MSANSDLDTTRRARQLPGPRLSTIFRRGSAPLLALSVGLAAAAGYGGAGCGGAHKPEPEAPVEDRIEPSAPQRRPPVGSPLVKEAEALLAKGDAAGAKAKFEAALAQQPDDARAYLGLGLSQESLEQLAAAEKSYRKAVELDPSLAEAHNNLGLLLRDKEDLEGAIAALTRATEADPRLASAQANLAMALEDAQRPTDADLAYAKAVKLAPDDAMVHTNYGVFLMHQDKPDAAAEQFQAALNGAKGDRAVLQAVGNGLRRVGRPDAAVRALQAAIAGGNGKPTPALLAELSLAQNAAKDDAGAKASLEQALQLDPKYATAHYLLGSILAGEGDFKNAVLHYKKCIEIEPKGELAKKAKEKLEAAQAASKKK